MGQFEIRGTGAAGGCGGADLDAKGVAGRALAGGQHASGRGRNYHRRASAAAGGMAGIDDRDRTAASHARRRNRNICGGVAGGAAQCRRHRRHKAECILPTRWASLGCSTGWRRSRWWAVRWCRSAGIILPRRHGSALPCCAAHTQERSPSWCGGCRFFGAIVEVSDAKTLAVAVQAWLGDPEAARAAGAQARRAFDGLEDLPCRLAQLILESSL